jgi:hypothetical protein
MFGRPRRSRSIDEHVGCLEIAPLESSVRTHPPSTTDGPLVFVAANPAAATSPAAVRKSRREGSFVMVSCLGDVRFNRRRRL